MSLRATAGSVAIAMLVKSDNYAITTAHSCLVMTKLKVMESHVIARRASVARRGNLMSGLLRHFVVLNFDNSQKRGFARLDVLGGLRRAAHLSKSAPRNDECYYAKPNVACHLTLLLIFTTCPKSLFAISL